MKKHLFFFALLLSLGLGAQVPLVLPGDGRLPADWTAEKLQAKFEKSSASIAAFQTEFKDQRADHAIADRLMLAEKLVKDVPVQLKKNTPDSLYLAGREITDLERFIAFFEAKRSLAKVTEKETVLNFADFGGKGDGVTDNADAFEAACKAIASHQGKPVKLVIPAGHYLIKRTHAYKMTRPVYGPDNPKREFYAWPAHVTFHDLANVTICGEKDQTELLFQDCEKFGIVIVDCRNIRLKDLQFRNARPSFIQGTIEQVLPKEKALVVKVDPGFLTPDDPALKPYVCVGQCYNPATGDLVWGASHFFFNYKKHVKLADRTYKVTPENFLGGFKAGLKIIMPYRKGGNIYTSRTTLARFEDLTVWNTAGSCFTETFSLGNEYRRCRVIPDAKAGAVFSSCADGIHCQFDYFGPYVEQCELFHQGDDAFNSYAKGRLIDAVESDGVIAGKPLPIGATFSILDAKTGQVKAVRTITKIGQESGGRKVLPKDIIDAPLPADIVSYASLKEAKLNETELNKVRTGFRDKALPDAIYLHGMSGTGTVIRDSSFGGNRNNLLVIQCSSTLIEGNQLLGCNGFAIYVAAILKGWHEGFHPFNVIVQNNVLAKNGVGLKTIVVTEDLKAGAEIPAICNFVHAKNQYKSGAKNAVFQSLQKTK